MKNVIFKLKSFDFPSTLEGPRSTFRMRITLSFIDEDGVLRSVDEMIPGAGEKDYFECERKHKDDKKVYVRSDVTPSIDMAKIISQESRKAVFSGLKAAKFYQVQLSIFDAEKDGFFDRFWPKAVQIAFGVSLTIFAAGLPITVGNLLTALKKDPKDRPEIEHQLDELIAQGISGKKMYLLGENDADVPSLKTGDTVRIQTSSTQYGDFAAEFEATVL